MARKRLARRAEGSDIDVAILGKRKIPFNLLLNLNDEFAHIFKTRELDVKSLHSTNPFFVIK